MSTEKNTDGITDKIKDAVKPIIHGLKAGLNHGYNVLYPKKTNQFSNEEIFFTELKKVKNPELNNEKLYELLRFNNSVLGIDAMLEGLNEEQIKEFAKNVASGFLKVQKEYKKNPNAFAELHGQLHKLNDRLSKLDENAQRALINQIKDANTEKSTAEAMKDLFQQYTGIDISDWKTIPQAMMKKMGIGSNNEDKDKELSEIEQAEKLADLKTISTYKGAIVGMIVLAPIGASSIASGILPIVVLLSGPLLGYDLYGLISKSFGSPESEGNFYNLITTESASQSGTEVVTPERQLRSDRSLQQRG